jgi:hypothetical protein
MVRLIIILLYHSIDSHQATSQSRKIHTLSVIVVLALALYGQLYLEVTTVHLWLVL